MSLVELIDVVKRYGQHTVLNGVSLNVEKGEIIAIIGRSGSGKSTLLRCVNGLEPIQGGTVAFDGTVVNDPRHRPAQAAPACRHRVPELQPLPHLSVEKNITLAPKVVKGMPPAEARRLAEAVLRKVGLAEKIDAYPDQLSGGQQQRVAIARSLAMSAAADAVRRDHLGARPRAGRRGAEGAGGDGARRHDHDAGDARDRLCPQGRRPRRLHARGQDLGGRPAAATLAQPRTPELETFFKCGLAPAPSATQLRASPA